MSRLKKILIGFVFVYLTIISGNAFIALLLLGGLLYYRHRNV